MLLKIDYFSLLTKALIFKIVFSGLVFAVTVTVFCCEIPACLLFGVKITSIVPFLPGITGSFGQAGTVQPQDPEAVNITKGSVPVLIKLNECLVC